MQPQFHALRDGHISRFRALLTVFGDAFEDPATYADAPPSDKWLQDLLCDETFFVVVAMVDGAVVGGLTAYELKKYEQQRSEIYIYDLAVAKEHRRRGIATGLIAHLQQIAARRGAWVILIQADPGDDPAIALYSKLGIREQVLHFDIPVPSLHAAESQD